MLRKILMTTVAATALAGSAFAADLPSRRPPVAYVPPVPIFTWTGFYIGVNAGGAFRANNNNNNGIFIPGVGFVAGNNSNNSARFIGGGQAGVNYQINQFVLGIEGDGQALVGNNNNNGNNFFNFGNNGNNTRFLGTVRGRGGIAFDRFLVYGTGGVAFGTGPTINNFNPFLVGAGPFANNVNNSNNWRVGYAVGAGVEYAFLNNWSVKVEYLYTDLGRTNNNNFFFGNNNNFRERDHIVRAGLNYKFDWFGAPAPVVARY
ncbi:MAG: porin family protein [Methylobacteriaceae bacterium]|nr:porin family protein [Methylobacteriaceae bacterium]